MVISIEEATLLRKLLLVEREDATQHVQELQDMFLGTPQEQESEEMEAELKLNTIDKILKKLNKS